MALSLETLMPDALKASTVAGLRLWQLLALPILGVATYLVGMLFARLTRDVFTRITRRTLSSWDDEVAAQTGGPLVLAWSTFAARLLSHALELPGRTHAAIDRWLGVGLFVALFWLLYRVVAVAAVYVTRSPWAVAHATARAFVPLAARIARVVVFGLGLVAVLAQLGYPVASLIAGLGIGGVAVALAAKSTLENLFGAFALGTDQPFQVGDFVKVDSTSGNVEAIGLRSTRIRTLDRTIVTIPNGKLAEMAIETFAVRDRLRFACTVALAHGVKGDQVRRVLVGMENVLGCQPILHPDGVTVRLKELTRESIDIEVGCWFLTSDWPAFQRIREEVLLAFMEVVEQAGARFAIPTRSVHLTGERGPTHV